MQCVNTFTIAAIERGDVYIHLAEESVNIGSNFCRILAASSLLVWPFTKRLRNNKVDAASMGDAINDNVFSRSSTLSSPNVNNTSNTSLEKVSLPPRMEQALKEESGTRETGGARGKERS